MNEASRAVGTPLLAALAASQAALVVLNPLLPDVAGDLGVSVGRRGQLEARLGRRPRLHGSRRDRPSRGASVNSTGTGPRGLALGIVEW
jgi:hypothetical protein